MAVRQSVPGPSARPGYTGHSKSRPFTLAEKPADITAAGAGITARLYNPKMSFRGFCTGLMVSPAGLHVTDRDAGLRQRKLGTHPPSDSTCARTWGPAARWFSVAQTRSHHGGLDARGSHPQLHRGLAGVAPHAAARPKVSVLVEALPANHPTWYRRLRGSPSPLCARSAAPYIQTNVRRAQRHR